MISVLAFVNTASSTSIPLEIAEAVHTETDASVTVASLYDDSTADLDPDVREFSVEIVPLGGDSRADLRAYRDLRRLLADADVLHTHHNSTGSLGRIAAVGTGVGVVDTEHNDHRHFSHLQNIVNCVTYPLTDAVVSNSESTRESFRAYERPFLLGSASRVIHNGIDFDRIAASGESAVTLPDGPCVASVGVMTDQKDQATLVQATARLVEHRPDVTLVLVGDGPKRESLERTARDLDVADDVLFTGYLSRREDVYALLKQADVFAISSRYEGFCNAVVEAMGCGLPPVVSDIDVLREVVGGSGRFAPPGDADAFAEEIDRLLDDPEARSELAGAARERAGRFPVERTAAAYYELYRSVA